MTTLKEELKTDLRRMKHTLKNNPTKEDYIQIQETLNSMQLLKKAADIDIEIPERLSQKPIDLPEIYRKIFI